MTAASEGRRHLIQRVVRMKGYGQSAMLKARCGHIIAPGVSRPKRKQNRRDGFLERLRLMRQRRNTWRALAQRNFERSVPLHERRRKFGGKSKEKKKGIVGIRSSLSIEPPLERTRPGSLQMKGSFSLTFAAAANRERPSNAFRQEQVSLR